MYKKILIGVGVLTVALIVCANVFKKTADVVIFSCMEDYRLDQLKKDLNENFKNIDISIQYMSTGSLMSRLKSEKAKTSADIVLGIEATNTEILLNDNPNLFHNLNAEFTTADSKPSEKYTEDILQSIPTTSYKEGSLCKYHVFDKEAGCIIVNKTLLEEKGKAIPTSFDDLLKDDYKGLICMPDPLYSGTGYYWFNGLVSCWGEQDAIDYFKALDKNMVKGGGYTTSGSRPLLMLQSNEAAIALGMSFQVNRYLNTADPNDPDLDVLYFDITDKTGAVEETYKKASPYTLYTMAVINTKWENDYVAEVYRYIYNEWTYKDKYMFDPETIYKKQNEQEFKDLTQQNFGNYKFASSYMPMKSVFDGDYKLGLLDKWSTWRNEYGK